MQKIKDESEMINFGRQLAKGLKTPIVIELIGDVGAGKTTITRGIAEGLGVKEPVTSPSFTISKRYSFPGGTLVHYDFYRLPDPGLMQDDLFESINDENTITIVEWADSVSDILPKNHRKFLITLNEDGSRNVEEIK